MRAAILLTASLALGACENRDRLTDAEATAPAGQPANELVVPSGDGPTPDTTPVDPGEVVYKALGTEPGWALTVRQAAMLYQGEYGTVRVIEATPPGFAPSHGRFRSGRLSISIAAGPCSDEMSDHVWRDTVTVAVAGGRTARGCGGGLVTVNAVENREYAVSTINGRPTGGGARFAIRFSGDVVSGTLGCNSFSGRFSRNGDHLAIPKFVATRMGCIGPLGDFQRDGFAVLNSNMRIEQQDDRTRLVSAAGTVDLVRVREGTPTT